VKSAAFPAAAAAYGFCGFCGFGGLVSKGPGRWDDDFRFAFPRDRGGGAGFGRLVARPVPLK
jgi:hypothetical protein